MQPIGRVFVGFLALCALQGCEVIFPPTELKEVAKFDSYFPPDPGNQMDRATKQLNYAAMEMAKASGQSEVVQLVDRKDRKPDLTPSWPAEHDLVLRAFFSRESLAACSVSGPTHSERSDIPEPVLNSIDFSKQFAVVLSRPKETINLPSTPDVFRNDSIAYYVDSLLREHTFGHEIVLRLQSRVLGQPPMLPREWSSKVFIVSREDATDLKLRVGEKEYVFPLHGESPIGQ